MSVERTGLVLVRAPVASLWIDFTFLASSLWATSLPSSSVLVSFVSSRKREQGDSFEFNVKGSVEQDASFVVSTVFESLS